MMISTKLLTGWTLQRGKPLFIFLIVMILALLNPVVSAAQDEGLEAPYYLVQEGDTLWGISARLGIPMAEIQTLNGISDPNQLMVGMRLLIPGPEAVHGRIDIRMVNYGDTLDSLSRRYRLPMATLAQLNRFTNPAELVAGAFIIVPVENKNQATYQWIDLAPGQSLLELALQNGDNLWTLVMVNNLWSSWAGMPGKLLQIRTPATDNDDPSPGGLPAGIEQVEISPFPLVQGKTIEIKVEAPPGIAMSGSLAGWELNFFPRENGYVALQGIHTQIEPGAYPLTLKGQLADGTQFAFSQPVLVGSTDYVYDPMLIVDPETVDPNVTEPEAALWASLGQPVTMEKMWDGLFVSPVPTELTKCWTSFFGNRRAYNGSTYDYFHSGLDFCGQVGTELYAPAAGEIVFTDSLIVRGNVVVINHGWGVYSAYDHLSEILVKPGDVVQPGQTIGLGGETGRTTGPHLHWEVWVGGVEIDPADWLVQVYP
jgi:murein DD-endopeptidase MepM/ murein hydrolase activator NlpD